VTLAVGAIRRRRRVRRGGPGVSRRRVGRRSLGARVERSRVLRGGVGGRGLVRGLGSRVEVERVESKGGLLDGDIRIDGVAEDNAGRVGRAGGRGRKVRRRRELGLGGRREVGGLGFARDSGRGGLRRGERRGRLGVLSSAVALGLDDSLDSIGLRAKDLHGPGIIEKRQQETFRSEAVKSTLFRPLGTRLPRPHDSNLARSLSLFA
jgi:hypothetical protein